MSSEFLRSFGPSLLWMLDELPGATVVADSSGNNRIGAVEGPVVFGKPGHAPGTTCAQFDKATNRINGAPAVYSPFVAGSKRTYMGWAYQIAAAWGYNDFPWIGYNAPFCFINGTDFAFRPAPGSTQADWATGWPGPGQWVHWAITYDDAALKVELFINGNSKGPVTLAAGNGYAATGQSFALSDPSTSGWNGFEQEFAIFERILTYAEIARIWQGEIPQVKGGYRVRVGWSARYSGVFKVGVSTVAPAVNSPGYDRIGDPIMSPSYSGAYETLQPDKYGPLSFTSTRGRDDLFSNMLAGQLDLVLNDVYPGRYNPKNPLSPLTNLLLPMRPCCLDVTFDGGATYAQIFNGWLDELSSAVDWDSGQAKLTFKDLLFWLDRTQNVTIAPTGSITVGAAIGLCLNAIGWPVAQRSLSTGSTIPNFSVSPGTSLLSAIGSVLEADMGYFFHSRDNIATYWDRYEASRRVGAGLSLNPALVWRLNEAPGAASVVDASGNSRHGTPGSGVGFGVKGRSSATAATLDNSAGAQVTFKNQVVNSAFDTNIVANWALNGANGSLIRVTDDKLFGTASLQVTTKAIDGTNAGTSYYHTLSGNGFVPTIPGQVMSFSCYAKARPGYGGTKINMQVNQTDTTLATLLQYSTGPDVALSETTWTRVTWSGTIVAGAVWCGLYINLSDTYPGLDSVWLINGVQFEVAPAPTDYSNNYLPFVTGSQRTFMGWGSRLGTADWDILFYGGNPTIAPVLYVEPGSENVGFRPNHNDTAANHFATWVNAWPGLTQWVHWALTWDDSTKVAELFINGVSQGAVTLLVGYGANSAFIMGNDSSSVWGGSMQEFAVYERILLPSEIRSAMKSVVSVPVSKISSPGVAAANIRNTASAIRQHDDGSGNMIDGPVQFAQDAASVAEFGPNAWDDVTSEFFASDGDALALCQHRVGLGRNPSNPVWTYSTQENPSEDLGLLVGSEFLDRVSVQEYGSLREYLVQKIVHRGEGKVLHQTDWVLADVVPSGFTLNVSTIAPAVDSPGYASIL